MENTIRTHNFPWKSLESDLFKNFPKNCLIHLAPFGFHFRLDYHCYLVNENSLKFNSVNFGKLNRLPHSPSFGDDFECQPMNRALNSLQKCSLRNSNWTASLFRIFSFESLKRVWFIVDYWSFNGVRSAIEQSYKFFNINHKLPIYELCSTFELHTKFEWS